MKPGVPPKSEHETQAMLFNWIRRNAAKSPNKNLRIAMSLCYAIPNGMSTKQSQKAKAEGLTAGIPDIQLAYPVTMYAPRTNHIPAFGVSHTLLGGHVYWFCPGLFLEAKFGNNDLSPMQKQKKALLEEVGWKWVTFWSVLEGVEAIMEYLPFSVDDYLEPEYY